jgi:FAD/FMN-containing dehydrogenase
MRSSRGWTRSPDAVGALARRLAEVVGERDVLVDPELRAGYEVDWTRRFHGEAALVVRPADADEVAAVLRACAEAGAPVVAQGGNSGLVGGAVPLGGEVLVSLARLDAIEQVDPAAAQLVAGAGTTLAALHAAAAEHGLAFGVDLAAREQATVGGLIATNAGGPRVLRHGPMAAQVVGLEAVLADGSVLRRMGAVEKDATGYDLPRVLCGSEGTLAVIVRARLRLVARQPKRVAALVAFEDVEAAVAAVARWRLLLPGLEAAELLFEDGLARVCAYRRVGRPFREPHPFYVLVEAAGSEDPLPALAAAIEDSAGVRATVVADDTTGRERLWALREGIPEALGAAGIVHKLDVGVPPPRLAELVARLPEAVRALAPAAEVVLIGHLAEGNVHVNVLGLAPDDRRVDEAVLELVAELGGSIGAEHGIGQAKTSWLGLTRDETDVRAMRAIKRALDPDWRLNPGKLLALPPDAPAS